VQDSLNSLTQVGWESAGWRAKAANERKRSPLLARAPETASIRSHQTLVDRLILEASTPRAGSGEFAPRPKPDEGCDARDEFACAGTCRGVFRPTKRIVGLASLHRLSIWCRAGWRPYSGADLLRRRTRACALGRVRAFPNQFATA
jgi:hypothetical protein